MAVKTGILSLPSDLSLSARSGEKVEQSISRKGIVYLFLADFPE